MTNTASPTNTTDSSISMAEPLWVGVRSTSGARREKQGIVTGEQGAGRDSVTGLGCSHGGMVRSTMPRGTCTQGVPHTAGHVGASEPVPGPRTLQPACSRSAVERFQAQTVESDCLGPRPAPPHAGYKLLGKLLHLPMPDGGS